MIDSYSNSHKKSLDRVIEILKINSRIDSIDIEITKADIRDEKILDKELFIDHQKG